MLGKLCANKVPLKIPRRGLVAGAACQGETQPTQRACSAAQATEPDRRWSCVSDPGASATPFQASGYAGRQTLVLGV